MSSPDNIGQDQPVYLENVVALRRNVQTRAATWLLLAAPVAQQINVPIASITIATPAVNVVNTSEPGLWPTQTTYFEQPATAINTSRWLKQYRWLLSTQPTLGPVISVPTASISITPILPTLSIGQMMLYLPSDDGWWYEEPIVYKPNAGYNFRLLAAPTTPPAIVINLPTATVTLGTNPPNVVASGNGYNQTIPVATITLGTIAPDVIEINSQTIQIPVAQINMAVFPPFLGAVSVPTASITMAVYPPTVINSSPSTIWDATFRCVNASLIIGQDQWVTNPTIPYGYVISQSPPSGTVVPIWTVVNFVVSFGPGATVQTATVPSVVGLEAYQAEQACSALGMDINPRAYAYSSTVAPDFVIAQSVPAGITVNVGTPISMTVSIGPAPTSQTVTVP